MIPPESTFRAGFVVITMGCLRHPVDNAGLVLQKFKSQSAAKIFTNEKANEAMGLVFIAGNRSKKGVTVLGSF